MYFSKIFDKRRGILDFDFAGMAPGRNKSAESSY
jgi:hypothetical protein